MDHTLHIYWYCLIFLYQMSSLYVSTYLKWNYWHNLKLIFSAFFCRNLTCTYKLNLYFNMSLKLKFFVQFFPYASFIYSLIFLSSYRPSSVFFITMYINHINCFLILMRNISLCLLLSIAIYFFLSFKLFV